MEFHRLSEIFPLMEEEELKELAQDIKLHGLRDQITLFEGKILDGRNRYRACLEAKVKPEYWTFEGDERAAERYVVSLNIHRRHLTKDARAEIIKKLIKANPKISNRKLAKELHVDERTIRNDKKALGDEGVRKIPHQPPVVGHNRPVDRSGWKNPVPPGEDPGPPPPNSPVLDLIDCSVAINNIHLTFYGKTGAILKEMYEALGSSEIERDHVYVRKLIKALDQLIEEANEWKQKILVPKVVELRRIK